MIKSDLRHQVLLPFPPKNFNKANAKEPSKQIEQLGYNPEEEGDIVNVEEKIKTSSYRS